MQKLVTDGIFRMVKTIHRFKGGEGGGRYISAQVCVLYTAISFYPHSLTIGQGDLCIDTDIERMLPCQAEGKRCF